MRVARRVVAVSVAAAAALLTAVVAPAGVPASTPTVDLGGPVVPRSAADGVLGSFSALGGGVSFGAFTPRVLALVVKGDDTVYVGGQFTSAGGVPNTARIAAWDDTWIPLGTGTSDLVRSLAIENDDTVYVGGDFALAGGVADTKGVAAWDDTWIPLGTGLASGAVYALALQRDDTLFAGGGFSSVNGASRSNIAAWNGTWQAPLGTGTNTPVKAASASANLVYVGGDFTSAGGTSNTRDIAAWNGSAWIPLGLGQTSGSFNEVSALSVSRDDTLFAGGIFAQMGDVASTTNIAMWDDTWLPVGGGTNDQVKALASDDTRGLVYVGGDFTLAGAVAANRVAVWDMGIQSWIPLVASGGTGVSTSNVTALALDDSLVYLGGNFASAGGVTVNSIARWTWDAPTATAVPSTAPAGTSIDLEGWGLIGVTQVRIDGVSVPFSRDDSTTVSVTLPGNLTPGVKTVAVDAVGGTATASVTVPTSYTVTFDPNGGSGSMAQQSSAVPANLTPNAFTRSGYSFTGWNTAQGGGGTPYANQATFPFSADDTLYAQWQANTPPPPPPVYPPGAPTQVAASAGDASARVTWTAPSDSGSYPVTDYEVAASPGGSTCLVKVPALSCEVTGLTNGTSYNFTVRGLNGAGWGPYSAPSNAVTPVNPITPTIMISGSRDATDPRFIRVRGTTTELAGKQVTPFVRFPGQTDYSPGVGVRTVKANGAFEWQRKTGKKTYVYFQHEATKSNSLVIEAR